jgi:hypothetical protein
LSLRQALLFALSCLVVIAILIGSSQSFQDCVLQRKHHQTYQALHEERPLLIQAVVRLELNAACARATAGENDGAITALATVVLAVFTFTLWRTSERQHREMVRASAIAKEAADGAKRSADALPALERAYMFLESVPTTSWRFSKASKLNPRMKPWLLSKKALAKPRL